MTTPILRLSSAPHAERARVDRPRQSARAGAQSREARRACRGRGRLAERQGGKGEIDPPPALCPAAVRGARRKSWRRTGGLTNAGKGA